MSIHTLMSMLEKYATEAIALNGPSAERPFDYSMNLPVERCFPGCIAFIGLPLGDLLRIGPRLPNLRHRCIVNAEQLQLV